MTAVLIINFNYKLDQVGTLSESFPALIICETT